MENDISKNLDVLFSDYKKLIAIEGQIYNAVSRLAEILHVALNSKGKQRDYWISRLREEKLSEEQLNEIERQVNKDVVYIKHVLSIGEKWESDEILLVLQQRVFIDLFKDFFRELYSRNMHLELYEVDTLIEKTAKTKLNKGAFETAISLMKKNWGLPIHSQWIDYSLVEK